MIYKAIVNIELLLYKNDFIDRHYLNDQTKIHLKRGEKRIEGIPYVNQKYDCPAWHNGNGSCAPATSIMVLAFYNILPEWNIDCQNPYPHVSKYGSYICDKYYFNGNFYALCQSAYGTDAWGAYGYMWNGTWSPSQGRMKSYLEFHGLVSSQLWTTSCTFEKIRNEIDMGYPFPVCSWLTQSGHLTLAAGYLNTSKTLIFMDPYGNKNGGYPNYNGQYVCYDWPGENNGFQNLDGDGTHGMVAWTVSARGSQPVYNDTIIDDLYFVHGFDIFNQPPAHMKYYHDGARGFNQHTWWTNTIDHQPDVCHVTWRPKLTTDGYYKVSVFLPSIVSQAIGARYQVHSKTGDTIVILDQNRFSDEWAEIGVFKFAVGRDGFVSLGDYTGAEGQKISFDAMKWEYFGHNPVKQAEMKITLYPNPAKELVFADFDMPEKRKVNFRIIDIYGNRQDLIFDEYVPAGKKTYAIDLSLLNLRPGLYFIRITDSFGGEKTKKLLLQ